MTVTAMQEKYEMLIASFKLRKPCSYAGTNAYIINKA